jgi:GT2 family glycosyltransferase
MENHATAPSSLSACVINRNGEAFLAETLDALLREGTRFSEVLLVDDASRDGSAALVRERFPSVRVIPLPENVGPAAARNAGYVQAAADRVLFLDNDVALVPGCVSRLMRALDDEPRAALAMPRVLYARDPGTIQYDGAGSHFIGIQSPENENRSAESVPAGTRRIRSLITACFLVDRKRWGVEPLFDPSFFIYLEDHDLGVRALLRGLEVLAVSGATCLHREGTEGLSLRRSGRYSPLRVRCLIRNRWLVILRDYSARSILLLFPAFALYEIAQVLACAWKGWLGIWGRSLLWLVSSSGRLRRERRRIQGARRRSDRDILSGGRLPLREEVAGGRVGRGARRALDGAVGLYWKLVSRAI